MYEDSLLQRTNFIIELLSDLKDVQSQLINTSSDIEKRSGAFYEKTFYETKNSIQAEIDRYKSNIEKIKQLNYDITAKINNWYEFSSSTEESQRITYPIRFHFKKSELKKSIKSMNEAISNLVIENRFIKEKIINWEHQLEIEAIMQIKQGNSFHQYEGLLNKKSMLISELKYLIPTVPDLCPIELDLSNLDQTIAQLSKIPAV
ncbi:MAG: hypothetical protein N3B21_15510 [Clostridia bacterium]|nr:hypothetical protein [Clostridia bacterium]